MASDTRSAIDMPASDESRASEHESPQEHIEVATTLPSVSPQLKNQKIKDGVSFLLFKMVTF